MRGLQRTLFRNIILLVLMLLLILSVTLTIYQNTKNNEYIYHLGLRRVSASAELFFDLETLGLTKLQYKILHQVIYDLHTDLVDYSITSKPLYKNLLRMNKKEILLIRKDNTNTVIYEKVSKLYNSGELHFELSVYSPTNNCWFNLKVRNPQDSIGIIVLLCIEAFIVLILFAYMFATQSIIKPWQRINILAKKLEIDISEFKTKIPVFGPLVAAGAAKSMTKMINHIEKLVDEKAFTLAAISHDIRTPLTRAKLYLQNKYPETNDPEFLEKCLNEIESILSQISTFSDGNKINEKFETLDVVSLIESIIFNLIEEGKSVYYEDIDLEPVFLSIQPIAFKRAIENIISNAIKYGQIAKVSIVQSINELSLIIEDEGPGIPEEELTNVFKPFYRLDRSRSSEVPGTGLGLSIVKNILDNHDTLIALENRQDKSGLLVRITWVLEQQSDQIIN
ncbi:ATP-binding protein [Francisellaceae bacterium]|nr:ATP-binding protein [Francisellaceae bacterium]